MPCNPKVTGWASGVPSMSSETVVVIFLAIWLTIQSGQTTLRNARRKKDSLTRCSLSCEDAPTKPAAARGSARSRRSEVGAAMRGGMTLFIQGYEDWDRYLARERGEAVPDLDPELDRRRLSGEIETALMAEDLGFDSLWTVEHHVSPYTMIPNPVQLLTFFAGATKKMDMGTMVVVLPWHHPLRVAEDITLLQYALRGRTPHIGFGRGAARREFRQLGFDMNDSKDVFAESIEVVKRALTQEVFSFEGEHF